MMSNQLAKDEGAMTKSGEKKFLIRAYLLTYGVDVGTTDLVWPGNIIFQVNFIT